MNLYVGNLNPETTLTNLRTLFSEFGEIVSAKIIYDNATGMSRGFGFVEYADRFLAFDAIDNLDCTFYEGNIISVKEAKQNNTKPGGRGGPSRPRTPRPGGNGYNNQRPGGYNSPRPGGGYNSQRPQGGGYNSQRPGGYNPRPSGGGYNSDRPGGYNNDRPGGYNSDRPNYNNDRPGGYQQPKPPGYNNPRPNPNTFDPNKLDTNLD